MNCCIIYRSTDDPIVGAELKKHMRDPYFLPPHSSEKNLAWIFMGSPGPGASLHVSNRVQYICCGFCKCNCKMKLNEGCCYLHLALL